MLLRNAVILALAALLTGCGPGYKAASPTRSPTSSNLPSPLPTEIPPTLPETPPQPTPEPPAENKSSICSKLDFSQVVWPEELDAELQTPLELALNVSGSFEGPDGWQNLTNNFDGQGVSMGLLNQNLGQGSLQPLLVEMNARFNDQMRDTFSASHLSSLLTMLKAWQTATGTAGLTDLSAYGLSSLDDPEEIESITGLRPEPTFDIQLLSQNAASVAWAVDNLYSGSHFLASWSGELKALAGSSGYRSIQIEASLPLHRKTVSYMRHFGFHSWRSYLFFFDIAVQNGGIPQGDFDILDRLFSDKPSLSEIQMLTDILNQRLTHVKAAYRADVKTRKLSLINGTGVVHGASRDYAKEFCADISTPI
jgi:hypothetical protein